MLGLHTSGASSFSSISRTVTGKPLYTFPIFGSTANADLYCQKKGFARAGSIRTHELMYQAELWTRPWINLWAWPWLFDLSAGRFCLDGTFWLCEPLLLIGVECLHAGKEPCTPDAAGNIGR